VIEPEATTKTVAWTGQLVAVFDMFMWGRCDPSGSSQPPNMPTALLVQGSSSVSHYAWIQNLICRTALANDTEIIKDKVLRAIFSYDSNIKKKKISQRNNQKTDSPTRPSPTLCSGPS
jgi:hypothetical protein